jgi:hypothetical protein
MTLHPVENDEMGQNQISLCLAPEILLQALTLFLWVPRRTSRLRRSLPRACGTRRPERNFNLGVEDASS